MIKCRYIALQLFWKWYLIDNKLILSIYDCKQDDANKNAKKKNRLFQIMRFYLYFYYKNPIDWYKPICLIPFHSCVFCFAMNF